MIFPQVLTELMKSASWRHIMGFIRNQFYHLLCWGFVTSDLVSGMRVLRGWDDDYYPFSVWALCRFCAPDLLGRDRRAKLPHVCYGYDTGAALRYIRDHGIHRQLLSENFSFMCQAPFLPVFNVVDARIRDVLSFGGLEEALAQIHVHPIGADCIVFSELFLHGEQIYRGPTSATSCFGGYHAVSIMSVNIFNGEPVAYCKLSNGPNVGSGGYVNVSLTTMIMCVGASSDRQDTVRATPWPTHLLTNFVALDMHENKKEK